jgi:hypothetical protein
MQWAMNSVQILNKFTWCWVFPSRAICFLGTARRTRSTWVRVHTPIRTRTPRPRGIHHLSAILPRSRVNDGVCCGCKQQYQKPTFVHAFSTFLESKCGHVDQTKSVTVWSKIKLKWFERDSWLYAWDVWVLWDKCTTVTTVQCCAPNSVGEKITPFDC